MFRTKVFSTDAYLECIQVHVINLTYHSLYDVVHVCPANRCAVNHKCASIASHCFKQLGSSNDTVGSMRPTEKRVQIASVSIMSVGFKLVPWLYWLVENNNISK